MWNLSLITSEHFAWVLLLDNSAGNENYGDTFERHLFETG